jgi:threonylcarbamoyladenosine tRNA methylthiotransferase MtaB
MESLATRLVQHGHRIVGSPSAADLCILNTCAVTHVAARKSRQGLRRLHRENPTAHLIATGCYAELVPADLHVLPGVDHVIGNRDKERLEQLIDAEVGESRIGEDGVLTAPSAPSSTARTRALVKIQDGCDNACTYCIIRVARGPQRSVPPDRVLAEVRARLTAGYKEIVLTGVHIGAYGHDRGGAVEGADLWTLVERILAETSLPRLRLSSIEPWDLTHRAWRLWDNPRLCRHLHVPLQSGCDATLQRMARRYAAAEFSTLVAGAREAIPDLAVTTDVIVGFPGETEAEFAESLAFVEAMGFARTHVFPYSSRPGTQAAQMPGHVSPPVKAARARTMRAVAKSSSQAFHQRFVGRSLRVLWESCRQANGERVWRGLTDNYLRVHAISRADMSNTITPTRLLAVEGSGLRGQIET